MDDEKKNDPAASIKCRNYIASGRDTTDITYEQLHDIDDHNHNKHRSSNNANNNNFIEELKDDLKDNSNDSANNHPTSNKSSESKPIIQHNIFKTVTATNNVSNFIRLINDESTSNNARNEAETKLKQLEDERFVDYILELCRILGSREEQDQTRQGAGLLLKNCIGATKERSEQYINKVKKRWTSIGILDKTRVRESVLKGFAESKKCIRKVCVNLAADLLYIDTIQKQKGWYDLPCTLVNYIQTNSSHFLTSSALECFGRIGNDKIHDDLLIEWAPKILKLIISAMHFECGTDQMLVKHSSLYALSGCFELFNNIIQDKKERQKIYDIIDTAINQGQNALKSKALIIFSQFMDKYYMIAADILNYLQKLTIPTIKNGIDNIEEDEDCIKQAIEVWSTCAESEYAAKTELEEDANSNVKYYGFVNKSLELLVPIYLQVLLKQKDEFDPDEWTICKAAACSLELFALVAGDNILSFVLEFIEQNIGSDDWRGRQAALRVFECILNGPSQNKLVQLTSQILPIILKLMGDQNVKVRAAAASVFGKVCELIPDAVSNKDVPSKIVAAVSDSNEICIKVCSAISALCKYFKNKKIECPFVYSQDGPFKLIKELLNRCSRSDCDGNVVIALHEAINNIIYYLPPSDQNAQNIKSLLPELVGQMLDCSEKCMKGNDNNNTQSMDIAMHRMAGLFSSIQVILDLFLAKLGRNLLNEELTDHILSACCNVYTLEIDNEWAQIQSLKLVRQVSRCMGRDFISHLQAGPVQKLLLKSITNDNENEAVCSVSAATIGDLYLSCTEIITQDPKKLEAYTDRIVSELFAILTENNYDKISIQLRGRIVDALTDILISHGQLNKSFHAKIFEKLFKIHCPRPERDVNDLNTYDGILAKMVHTINFCVSQSFVSIYIKQIIQLLQSISLHIQSRYGSDALLKKTVIFLNKIPYMVEYLHMIQLRNPYTRHILTTAMNHQNDEGLVLMATKTYSLIFE